jgi:hypothetical protein
MKKLLIVLSFTFLLQVISAKELGVGSSDFRKVNWGMSMELVKRSETAKFYPEEETDQILIYRTNIASLETFLSYYFVKDSLVKAKYLLDEKHSNKNLHINDFKTLKSKLKEKYGSPDDEDVIWRNDLYKDDSKDWGLAVSLGHLLYYATWETNGASIIVLLDGDNYTIRNQIEYISKKYGYLIDEQNKKKALDDF